MQAASPHYGEDDIAAQGEAIFARDIEPRVRIRPGREFVLIDILSGDYEVDADDLAAEDRLFARRPDALIWMRRVGSADAYRFGLRPGQPAS